MTTSSTGANTKVGFQSESTYGEIPGVPALKEIPFASASFTTSQDEILDSRLDGSRDVKDVTFGNKQVSADIAGDFSSTDYDDLIDAFMFSPTSITSGPITIGSTLSSFIFEEAQLDISKFRKFTGMAVNTMAIEAPIDGNATISFGLVGKEESYTMGGTTANESIDADGYDEAPFNKPFRHVDGTIADADGSLIGAIQSVSLNGDNQLSAQFTWGSDTVASQVSKKAQITGSVTVYYVDETRVNKWLSGDASSMEFSLTDGTDTYTFTMPKTYYTGADMGVSDDGIRTITLPFRAVNSVDTSLKITKS